MKGAQFNSWRSVGLVAQAVRIHQARGVDEMCLLDISATAEQRGPDIDLIRELSETCFMPLAVGGGIRDINDAKAILRAGADKIVIGTAGLLAMKAISDVVGAQAIVASIDYKDGKVWARSGTIPTGQPVQSWSRLCEDHGAGELLLTSIDREGMMTGYDLQTLNDVSQAVDIPVIAHAGAGTYQDMLQAIQAGASAVAAGAMFQFTDQTPRGACEYLAARGVEARL